MPAIQRFLTAWMRGVCSATVAVVLAAVAAGPSWAQAAEAPANVPQKAVPQKAVLERRSWGDTYMPTSPPPARRMQAVSLHGLPAEERVAVTCLQGLLARKQPRLFLVRNEAEDRFWMDWYVAKGHVDAFEPVADWKTLVRDHRDVVKGVVVPDPALYRGDLLAANVAACEDLLVGSPRLAEQLGLPVVVDLRGRFTTYVEGLSWLWATYKDRLNPHLCDFRFPGLLRHGTFDYAFQWRGLMFWVAGPREESLAGVDRRAERDCVARILAEMPAGGVCVGFPAMGDGEGMGEPPGVELLSRFGKSLVCTNHNSNYSFSSGIRIDRLTPPPSLPVLPLDRDKIYIALNLSDGDNQILWPVFFRRYFAHPAHGTLPLAFGMGPAIRELQPAVAQWYFEHAAATTEFFADVSGAGYMQPDHFAEAYADREPVWADYLGRTRRLMEPLGMRTIRTVGGSDENVARYAAALPFCHSIFADMGRYSGRSGIESLTYSLPYGMPVFRAVTSWRYGKEGFLREVREQVGDRRPAFVNGFVHCWTFSMDDLVKIHAARDADMVFVTPAQLAALYKEHLAARSARSADWTIRDGRLFVDGRWVFLKIGKPLRNFADPAACQKLVDTLDTLQAKGFNALELNCYWHHFDKDGDGTIDVSLEPLARLVDAIHAKGMFPCLSVETYGVGGGQIPQPFWTRHPDAVAINSEGQEARDVEYGFKTAVPSILHPGYRAAVHAYIRGLVAGLPHRKILFYETTVEPQFMGHQDLDYGPHARRAYEAWLEKQGPEKQGLAGPVWPEAFPVPESFRTDPVWLRFRAESLAEWVNGDAAAFRAAAGADAYIAVDYLETCNATMPRRNGDSVRFLEALTGADIIQVNWHWRTDLRGPNECAYRNVWDVKKRLGRPWAISEHMTLNGSDYLPEQVPAMLRNALSRGTGFGWEFVNVAAASRDPFALYEDDWSPKRLMAEVDDHWPEWTREIAARPVPQ